MTKTKSLLKQRRRELGWSQKHLAELSRTDIEFINHVETFRLPAGIKIETIRNKLNRIALAVEMDFSQLFPPGYLNAIQHRLLPRREKPLIWIREVGLHQLDASVQGWMVAPSAEDIVIERERLVEVKRMVREAVSRLAPMKAKILTMRFGLDGAEPMLAKEVATALSIPLFRVKSRQAGAITDLRNSCRIKKLKNCYYSRRVKRRKGGA